ncbi:MAG: MarR family transcriptional regulator [Saprospiraceae bacterium]
MKIEEALQQKKFSSEYQKAHLNILYTAAWLNQVTASVLKPYGLSSQQFNILRILRGRHPAPASVKLLTERMIDKMSNASRLVDKLLEKGYVERIPCDSDRRRVDVSITDAGLKTLAAASTKMDDTLAQLKGTLALEEAELLNSLLDKMRG